MTPQQLPSLEDEKKKFITNFAEYHPLPLKDDFGFSIIKSLGSAGWGSIFYIYINHEDIKTDKDIKPLTVLVNHGRIIENKDGTYLTLNNRDKIKKVTGPIEFASDDYSYNKTLDKFYKKNIEITAKELFADLYLLHTKPTRPLRGFWLRLKLFFGGF